jgi:penicillin G amidase
MDQSRTWEEFRDACTFNHIPAENMIWADKNGNIGWQATGITPLRNGFSGLVASLGDGSMDWDGFLPIAERPHKFNPEEGYLATANENVTPKDYPHKNAIGYEWADAFRGDRVREVLAQGKRFTMKEMGDLQNDYLALPARKLLPYLTKINFENPDSESAKNLLKNWDFKLQKNSVPAGIYVMWERKIRHNISNEVVPEEVSNLAGSIQLTRIIEWVENPEKVFPHNPRESMDKLLKASFEESLIELGKKLGNDRSQWQYGQTNFKHAYFRHPLSLALAKEWRPLLDAGPVERGGYSFTPSANAYGDNNSSGASFRIIVDTGDWEKTMGINTPGQSGDPSSPFYKNLFPIWAGDGYFNVSFSYGSVVDRAVETILLKPGN